MGEGPRGQGGGRQQMAFSCLASKSFGCVVMSRGARSLAHSVQISPRPDSLGGGGGNDIVASEMERKMTFIKRAGGNADEGRTDGRKCCRGVRCSPCFSSS